MIEKNLHTLVPMEDCVDGLMYAISLNLIQQHDVICPQTKVLLIKDRPSAHRKHTQKILRLTSSFMWKLKMEVSPTGRLHWHGYIIVSDVRKFYIYDVPVLMRHMSICMKRITDQQKWELYCQKQAPLMNEYSLTHITWAPGPIAEEEREDGVAEE